MNKNDRLVRGGMLAAAIEDAWSGVRPNAVYAPLAAAVGGLLVAPDVALATGCAAPGPSPVSSVLTSAQCYVDQNVSITSGGGILVTVSMTPASPGAVQIFAPTYTSTLTNNGTIGISGTSVGYGVAYGVQLMGDLAGSLTNAGTISANLTGIDDGRGYAYPGAYALQLGNILPGASFVNTGTISAVGTGMGTGTYGTGYGVQTGDIAGRFVNAGTISATGNGEGASVVLQVGNITSTGSLTNSGVMAAVGNGGNNPAVQYSYASATVMNVYGTLDGTLTNTGSMSATANNGGAGTVQNGSYATGIYLSTVGSAGQFTNTGTISATATVSGPGAYANTQGIYLNYLAGTFNNSGTISGTTTGTGSGVVNLSASGLYVYSLTGLFANSGTISGTASGQTGVTAYGMQMYSPLSGTLNNSGVIRGAAQAASGGTAYGVWTGSTLDGTINNSGTVSATGAGGMDPNGVYSIYVSGGGAGTINNMAGGLLDGQVYAPGSVSLNNAGTLDTRLQASVVGGNYTQAASGVLAIGATSNATHGSLSVGGTANLAAGTGFRVTGAAGNTLSAGTVSGVLTSGGLTMSSSTVVDNVLSLNYVAVANGNNVDLVATATGIPSVSSVVSGGVGSSVGSTIDGLLASIDSQPKQLQDFLYSLGAQTTPQGVKDAVQKVLPMINTSTTQAGVNTSQGVNNVVLARLDNVMGRSAGDKFYGDRKAWLKPFGSWADQDDHNGVVGYSARSAGLVGGIDADVGDYRLGVAFGYARSDIDGNSSAAPQSARVDSYQLVFYGDRRLDAVTDVNFQVGLGTNDNSGRRTINFGTTSLLATANYGSLTGYIGGGVSRDMKLSEASTFTPSLRADYTWIRNNAYVESGAGALGLNVNASDFAKFVVALDGKFVSHVSDRTTLSANLAGGYDFINETASVTSAFAGSPGAAFTTQGIKPSPWLVRGGAGMTYRTSERVEVTGRYDFEARTGFTNQTVSVNARWSF